MWNYAVVRVDFRRECLLSANLDDTEFRFGSFEILCPTKAAAKREHTLVGIHIRRWMSHAERAVHSFAVLKLDLAAVFNILHVAWITEVVGATAVK